MRNQFLIFVLFPILSAVLSAFVRCKINQESEMGRCLIIGVIIGMVSAVFLFLGNALGGGS